MTEWELCYSPDYSGFSVTVDPAEIVPPASVQGRGTPKLDLEDPEASRDRPITLHREYNWRQADGTWRRWCVGFREGRERVARAQHDCVGALEVVVFGCAFWPPGARPDDRFRIPAGEDRFTCTSFDAARGAWIELPDDEWDERQVPSDS
jgi:hypothetical protein